VSWNHTVLPATRQRWHSHLWKYRISKWMVPMSFSDCIFHIRYVLMCCSYSTGKWASVWSIIRDVRRSTFWRLCDSTRQSQDWTSRLLVFSNCITEMSRLFACDVTTPLLATFSNLLSYIKLFYSRFKPSEQVCVQLSCSDPSGPVNSCIFVAVLYFPVFRLWSCIFLYFYLLLFSVAFIRLLWSTTCILH